MYVGIPRPPPSLSPPSSSEACRWLGKGVASCSHFCGPLHPDDRVTISTDLTNWLQCDWHCADAAPLFRRLRSDRFYFQCPCKTAVLWVLGYVPKKVCSM